MELYVISEKIGSRQGKIVLQQGDYEQKWDGKHNESGITRKLKEMLPWELQCVIKHFGLMIQNRKLLKSVKI